MAKQKKSARRQAREYALQGVYAWIISGFSPQEVGAIDAHVQNEAKAEFGQADITWYKTLLYGVFDQHESLREHFQPFLDRDVNELSPIEHGVLLLGTYELVHSLDVPYRVAINEAVELAKEFGGVDGFKFVNGVLDKVAAEVRPSELSSAN